VAFKLRVSVRAHNDLQGIWDYISEFSVPSADKTVDAIVDAYMSLLEHPFRGRSRDDLRPSLRNLVVNKYLVFYRVENEVIFVSRIIHGARDLESIFKEEQP